MRWSEVEAAQPRLAEVGLRKLADPGVVLVGTIRRDGSPRISPVEPMFWEGDLWLSMGWGSMKARDLRRDPRVLVHSLVPGPEGTAGEYKVRGRAIAVSDRALETRFAAAVKEKLGWEPEVGKFHLFRIEIDDLTFIRWDHSNNDQYVTRWPGGAELLYPGTSAQSHGPPRPISELLD